MKIQKSNRNKFKDAKRQQHSLLAPYELKALNWVASRMPAWINPDQLTVTGFVAMFFAGLFFFFSRSNPMYLHLVNLCLGLNWFGDSLDGTLARYRHKERPRYGFYVDHIVDTFGTFFLIAGLALSSYMSERVAVGVIIVYFMLSINAYLATYTVGIFRLSHWKLSPTELRILLALGNIALLYYPHVRILDRSYLLFDIGGTIGIVFMIVMLISSAFSNIQILYRLEEVE